jgi:hypothetical protein
MSREVFFMWVRYWLNLFGMAAAVMIAAFALLLLSRM